MGSAAIGALVAHVTFWTLVSWGWLTGEIGTPGTVIFLALWVLGFFGLPYLPYGSDLFLSYVAVLDIALVFTVLKGDVKLN